MTKQELNSWAVMNLSMEDRGLKPQEAEDGPGLGRFLSGNLSYFGGKQSTDRWVATTPLMCQSCLLLVKYPGAEVHLAWHLVHLCDKRECDYHIAHAAP